MPRALGTPPHCGVRRRRCTGRCPYGHPPVQVPVPARSAPSGLGRSGGRVAAGETTVRGGGRRVAGWAGDLMYRTRRHGGVSYTRTIGAGGSTPLASRCAVRGGSGARVVVSGTT